MLNLQSWFGAVKKHFGMAKISIPVNFRDLREALQCSLELVPSAKVPGLLRALEKIAGGVSGAASFEIGVTALRHIDGRWELQPKLEDLQREGVVIGVLHGSDRKALMAVHSNLFEMLFPPNDHPPRMDLTSSARVKTKRVDSNGVTSTAVQEKRNGAGDRGEKGAVPRPDSLAQQSLLQDVKPGREPDHDHAPGSVRGPDKRITISEKPLFLAIKNSLDGLEFGELLSLNRWVLDVVDSLKNGSSLPALKCTKRLVGLGDALHFELENEDPTSVSLVRGLLGGLGMSTLIQLHGEFSVRLNVAHAGARKVPTSAIKAA
jgi:hypothetical protein